jgi:hypothetical protein
LPAARQEDGPLCTPGCTQRSIIIPKARARPDNSKKGRVVANRAAINRAALKRAALKRAATASAPRPTRAVS